MTPPMRVVVIGLSLSSSWGNGHATTYRALLKAMAARGHHILFLENDVPWYAENRDLYDPDFCDLRFYRDFSGFNCSTPDIKAADLVIVGSFVPDGTRIGAFVQEVAEGITAFYDIDTPVTLAKLRDGEFDYISPAIIPEYDLYLSFTGGPTLKKLETLYGAKAARPLHCSVDPGVYQPPASAQKYYDLGYLGTYSDDRQPTLERLLIEPARRLPQKRFIVAGPKYPSDIFWPENVARIDHVAPNDHANFYAACRFTLNVTRLDMILAGFSPSVRLFEAAACGCPIISDIWNGIDSIFAVDDEVLLARTSDDVISILTGCSDAQRQALGANARARVLHQHTANHRALELESYVVVAQEARSFQERAAE